MKNKSPNMINSMDDFTLQFEVLRIFPKSVNLSKKCYWTVKYSTKDAY